jgi:hypothetical protein
MFTRHALSRFDRSESSFPEYLRLPGVDNVAPRNEEWVCEGLAYTKKCIVSRNEQSESKITIHVGDSRYKTQRDEVKERSLLAFRGTHMYHVGPA